MVSQRRLIGLALLAFAGAALWLDRDEPPPRPVAGQRTDRPSMAASGAAARAAPDPAAPRFTQVTAGNLFMARAWQTPPEPVPAPAAAPAPAAPALPFRYLGQRIDNGVVTLFLGQGERTHLVREGDQLPNYRVDRITAGQVTLTYLPLDQSQRLTFGAPP